MDSNSPSYWGSSGLLQATSVCGSCFLSIVIVWPFPAITRFLLLVGSNTANFVGFIFVMDRFERSLQDTNTK